MNYPSKEHFSQPAKAGIGEAQSLPLRSIPNSKSKPASKTSEVLPAMSSWKTTILEAKAAHARGDRETATKLYRLGLEEALQALGDSRSELVTFLAAYVWESETEA